VVKQFLKLWSGLLRIKISSLCFIGVILSGCAAQTMDIQINVDESGTIFDGVPVRVIPKSKLANKEYATISSVRGISCKRYTWDPAPTPEAALEKMKLSALSTGGNVITDVQCGNIGGAVFMNCWSAIECHGTVVRAKLAKTKIAQTPKITKPSKSDELNPALNLAQNKSRAFPSSPIDVQFRPLQPHPHDIAVIIGNADYQKGKDIPNVIPAYADAASIKNYVTQALGIKEENIIYLKDAGQSELTATFGSATNPKGQLFNYVKPGKSRVFVYYSGHGAPGGEDGSSYIVPTDAQASLIDLNGYPLSTLYKNLGKIPAKSVTVVLEACFSGASQLGSVITQASPIYLKAKETVIPSNLTVIAAGAANQIASWEQDSSSGLFTKYFLKGMSGEADAAPYGNGNGEVEYDELGAYFKDTLTYYARRYYGRDQTVQIVEGGL
jgi:hypothetical protein